MSLRFDVVNNTAFSTAYVYVTGLDLAQNNAWVFLQSDGRSLYHPTSPAAPITPLAMDCAVPLGPPGSSISLTIPHMVGARIWFSIGAKLQFFLNPGPAVVMPSVNNPSDPNINVRWDFAEFTYDYSQLFANISYVDFFSVPIGMALRGTSGNTCKISGTLCEGLADVVRDLEAQGAKDGAGWERLVYRDDKGSPLRVLSPNSAMGLYPSLLSKYFDAMIDAAWQKYASTDMVIDTQAAAGVVRGKVGPDGVLRFPASSFTKPSSADVWNNSTGPFRTDGISDEARAIIPRLAAAFNRSTILDDGVHPTSFAPHKYHKADVTNHYARVLHEKNCDGKGYAFPYDDVCACEEENCAGVAYDGSPESLVFFISGGGP